MSHTLLVHTQLPEPPVLYLIPNEGMPAPWAMHMAAAHNRYINSDDNNHGMLFVSTAVRQTDPDPGFEEHLGVLVPFRVDPASPIVGATITAVYVTGFVL